MIFLSIFYTFLCKPILGQDKQKVMNYGKAGRGYVEAGINYDKAGVVDGEAGICYVPTGISEGATGTNYVTKGMCYG